MPMKVPKHTQTNPKDTVAEMTELQRWQPLVGKGKVVRGLLRLGSSEW